MTIKLANVASNPTDLWTLSRGGGSSPPLARAVFVTPVRVCPPAHGLVSVAVGSGCITDPTTGSCPFCGRGGARR